MTDLSMLTVIRVFSALMVLLAVKIYSIPTYDALSWLLSMGMLMSSVGNKRLREEVVASWVCSGIFFAAILLTPVAAQFSTYLRISLYAWGIVAFALLVASFISIKTASYLSVLEDD